MQIYNKQFNLISIFDNHLLDTWIVGGSSVIKNVLFNYSEVIRN